MKVSVHHQVGHNASWNIDSLEKDHCGDGLILSPVHQAPASIDKLLPETLKASIFDPQFYVPSSQKPKLLQYDFFPEKISSGGFATTTFEANVKDSAQRCIEFQRSKSFRRITVPTRFLDQMHTNYVDRQKVFCVDAFMDLIDPSEEVCLSLAVTSAMLEDEGFRTKLLSWITSYSNVHELYLIYSNPRDTKQIHDADFLVACHRLGQEMNGIGLQLTWGHQNTEAILSTAQGKVGVSIGSFENTRIFSTDKFIVTDEDRRGPKARVFLKGLLNWIQFEQAKEIREKIPTVWANIYEPTTYAEAAFSQVLEPTFNQPLLYKHYFLNMCSEAKLISTIDVGLRKKYLRERIEKAQAAYAKIGKSIQLERHGQGTHLGPWLKAVDLF
jgi:hypothetical protein